MEQTEKDIQVLSDKIYFTRLAEGLENQGYLTESALSRLDSAFFSMRETLDRWQVKKISVVATSASRQAQNKNRLYELGKKYRLDPIEIISPEREAELTFIGAFFGLGHEGSSPLVVDIGGGSAEFAGTTKSYSLNIGSVSLTEKFLDEKPVSRTNRQALVQCVQSHLKGIESFLKEKRDTLVFVAGTPVTLAFMEKQTSDSNQIHGLTLTEDQLLFWLEKLAALSVEQRKKIPYLPEYRSDVIVSGLIFLHEILKSAEKKEFIVSATGVRYGLILEQL